MTSVGADLGRWRAAASSSSSPPLTHESPAQLWARTGRDGTPPSPAAAAPVPPVTICRTKTLGLRRPSPSRTRRPPTPDPNKNGETNQDTKDGEWLEINCLILVLDILSHQLFWYRVSVQDQRVGGRSSGNLLHRGATMLQTLSVTCRRCCNKKKQKKQMTSTIAIGAVLWLVCFSSHILKELLPPWLAIVLSHGKGRRKSALKIGPV